MDILTENQLVSELWAWDVRFIMGRTSTHPPKLRPTDLVASLASSREARLQLSLIPLFMRHPEFAHMAEDAAQNLKSDAQLILKCFYSAAVWLEQKYLSREALPDLFSQELGLSPSKNPDENLKDLAKRQRELSRSRINWLGTYQHAAVIWLRELELQKT